MGVLQNERVVKLRERFERPLSIAVVALVWSWTRVFGFKVQLDEHMGQRARMGTKSGRGRAPIYGRRRGARQIKKNLGEERQENHSVSEQWTSVT